MKEKREMDSAQAPLTEEQQRRILQKIEENMNDDDRDPNEVIKDIYAGDRERYLRDMAAHYDIDLD